MLDLIEAPRPLVLAIGIAVAMLACNLTRATEAARVAGFVAALVLLAQDGESWIYAVYRLAATALGIVVAWLLASVPTLFSTYEPKD